jgi:Lon protease-like protein
MDIHTELGDFSGFCRLFPLPNVVLFPHVILPLHIFEPRYRQMTQDALDDDQLVTIVQALPRDPHSPWVEPVRIADVACVGKIVRHERLADGRFNMLLLGCKRVRLEHEIASGKLYRIAEATVLEDEELGPLPELRKEPLIERFLEVVQARHAIDPDLTRLLRSDLDLGTLSDIIAHALALPAAEKQALLAETRVERRVDTLMDRLQDLGDEVPHTRRFPPPFSCN